jgi:hypothetical protein
MNVCEIADCPHPVLSIHRQDEGGHLCACHFYALAVIESRHQSLDMPEGPRRRYFVNAVKLIGQVQRTELLAWREKNQKAHESRVTS